jgi:hypothetical protein
MKAMKWVYVATFVLVSGCVTTSAVVPMGKDSYMLTASNDACGNCSNPPQIRAAQQANAYCDSLGLHMIVRRIDHESFDMGYGHKATITFSCVRDTDTEYARPNLTKDPTTVIEDRRKR